VAIQNTSITIVFNITMGIDAMIASIFYRWKLPCGISEWLKVRWYWITCVVNSLADSEAVLYSSCFDEVAYVENFIKLTKGIGIPLKDYSRVKGDQSSKSRSGSKLWWQ
jgi:hypothetical protein